MYCVDLVVTIIYDMFLTYSGNWKCVYFRPYFWKYIYRKQIVATNPLSSDFYRFSYSYNYGVMIPHLSNSNNGQWINWIDWIAIHYKALSCRIWGWSESPSHMDLLRMIPQCYSHLKPQDSFGEFNKFFLDLQKVQEIIRKHHNLPAIVWNDIL